MSNFRARRPIPLPARGVGWKDVFPPWTRILLTLLGHMRYNRCVSRVIGQPSLEPFRPSLTDPTQCAFGRAGWRAPRYWVIARTAMSHGHGNDNRPTCITVSLIGKDMTMKNMAVLLAVCCGILALASMAAATNRVVVVEMMTANW